MEQGKKILLSLPLSTLNDLDEAAEKAQCSRSELIRTILYDFLRKQRIEDLTEQMKLGYQQMAHINRTLAEEATALDTEQETSYEETLSECE